MSGFHDILFPIKMARGATGGPVRSTSVKTSASGKEARNTALYNSRRRYEISSKGSNIDELSEIIDFFEARMGRLYAFRFKDPLDNKSCAPSSVPSGMDQEIGTSDGAETAFQLVKKYGDAKGEYVRKITKPVLNSVIVSIDGLTISPTEYTVDYQTGSLTFNAAPTSGATIKAGYQFDIPVRFDNDALDFALDGFGAGHLSSIALVGGNIMRNISSSFAQKLNENSTKLCAAWEFIREDGVELRITNHDRDLNVSGETFKSAPIIDAGQIEITSNLSPDSFHAIGAYDVAGIDGNDILLGRWDNASLKFMIVDWSEPENFVVIWSGKISGFKQSKFGFELDLLGPEGALSRTIGRQFTRHCDAELGDNRCQLNFEIDGRKLFAQIELVEGDRAIKINKPQLLNNADFKNGTISFNSGKLSQLKFKIHNIDLSNDFWRIELERPMMLRPQIGDSVILKIGCDKAFLTCKNKFANQVNFRGCPNMPGDDFAFSTAK